jgi:hypothetical protein
LKSEEYFPADKIAIKVAVCYKRSFFQIMAIAIFLGALYGIYPCCERKNYQNLKFRVCRGFFARGPFLHYFLEMISFG